MLNSGQAGEGGSPVIVDVNLGGLLLQPSTEFQHMANSLPLANTCLDSMRSNFSDITHNFYCILFKCFQIGSHNRETDP